MSFAGCCSSSFAGVRWWVLLFVVVLSSCGFVSDVLSLSVGGVCCLLYVVLGRCLLLCVVAVCCVFVSLFAAVVCCCCCVMCMVR